MTVFAKITSSSKQIYYVGSSFEAIKRELTNWDNPDMLMVVDEADAKDLPYYKEGKMCVERGLCDSFNIGIKGQPNPRVLRDNLLEMDLSAN